MKKLIRITGTVAGAATGGLLMYVPSAGVALSSDGNYTWAYAYGLVGAFVGGAIGWAVGRSLANRFLEL
jgi:hypothetical protein